MLTIGGILRGRRVLLSLLLGLTFMAPQRGQSSADCGACMVKESALQGLRGEEENYLALLEKNNRVLASLAPDETSKGIKIKSNISMINIRIQAVRDNIIAADLDISRSCKECQE
jgi:hypothetical protein